MAAFFWILILFFLKILDSTFDKKQLDYEVDEEFGSIVFAT